MFFFCWETWILQSNKVFFSHWYICWFCSILCVKSIQQALLVEIQCNTCHPAIGWDWLHHYRYLQYRDHWCSCKETLHTHIYIGFVKLDLHSKKLVWSWMLQGGSRGSRNQSQWFTCQSEGLRDQTQAYQSKTKTTSQIGSLTGPWSTWLVRVYIRCKSEPCQRGYAVTIQWQAICMERFTFQWYVRYVSWGMTACIMWNLFGVVCIKAEILTQLTQQPETKTVQNLFMPSSLAYS